MLRTLAVMCGGLGLMDVAYIDFTLGPRTFGPAPAAAALILAAPAAPGVQPALPPVASLLGEASTGASGDRRIVKFADPGQSTLSEEAKELLQQVADEFARRRDVSLSIIGHADARGDSRENLWLGERRAHTVAEALLAAGFSADQIEVRSQGEAAPVVPGSGSDAWAENRRVDIEVRAKRGDRP